MALLVLNGPVIEAGESLSSGLDCTGGTIVRITMPAIWTPANLTIQISSDGEFYNDLVDHAGEEIMLTVVPGTAMVLRSDWDWRRALAHIKFRSGTRNFSVQQQERVEFSVAVEPSV